MYGHVVTKFSRMGRLLHFLTHGAALARFARESSANSDSNNNNNTNTNNSNNENEKLLHKHLLF